MTWHIRPLQADDRAWAARWLEDHWHATTIVSRGRLHQADRLPGFAAWREGQAIGLITYCVEGDQCEIVTLDSLAEGLGIGTALIEAVKVAARQAGCARAWLITTNDNCRALRFYQKRGFVLAALHRNAIEHSRRLKPAISQIGIDGIPIRDEIELELAL